MDILFSITKKNGEVIGFSLVFEGESAAYAPYFKEAFLAGIAKIFSIPGMVIIKPCTLELQSIELSFRWENEEERKALSAIIQRDRRWHIEDIGDPPYGLNVFC